jgi:hypothetical protein
MLRNLLREVRVNASRIRSGLAIWSDDKPDNLRLWEPDSSDVVDDEWLSTSDLGSIGGKSTVSVRYAVTDEGPSAVVFSGDISLERSGKVAKSGYAAMRHSFPWREVDLGEYEGLAMRVKSDGRTYMVNAQTDTFIADDLYQVWRGVCCAVSPHAPRVCRFHTRATSPHGATTARVCVPAAPGLPHHACRGVDDGGAPVGQLAADRQRVQYSRHC